MISLTEQWKKHQPIVSIENDKLIIKVWRDIPHPMEETHLIDSVDILLVSKAGLLRVKHFDLIAGTEPKLEIPLSEFKSWVYKVQTRCNLHWTWEDEFVI